MFTRFVAFGTAHPVSQVLQVLAAAGTAALTPSRTSMGRYGKNKPKVQHLLFDCMNVSAGRPRCHADAGFGWLLPRHCPKQHALMINHMNTYLGE